MIGALRENVIEERSVHFITSMTGPLLPDVRNAVHLPCQYEVCPHWDSNPGPAD